MWAVIQPNGDLDHTTIALGRQRAIRALTKWPWKNLVSCGYRVVPVTITYTVPTKPKPRKAKR